MPDHIIEFQSGKGRLFCSLHEGPLKAARDCACAILADLKANGSIRPKVWLNGDPVRFTEGSWEPPAMASQDLTGAKESEVQERGKVAQMALF